VVGVRSPRILVSPVVLCLSKTKGSRGLVGRASTPAPSLPARHLGRSGVPALTFPSGTALDCPVELMSNRERCCRQRANSWVGNRNEHRARIPPASVGVVPCSASTESSRPAAEACLRRDPGDYAGQPVRTRLWRELAEWNGSSYTASTCPCGPQVAVSSSAGRAEAYARRPNHEFGRCGVEPMKPIEICRDNLAT
jgi:hypothetical protein